MEQKMNAAIEEKSETDFEASKEAKVISVDGRSLEVFFAEMKKADRRVKVVYYSPFARQAFYVQHIGKDGKPILKTHPVTGVPIMSGGKYLFVETCEDFEPMVMQRTAKTDCLCIKQVISDEHGIFTSYQQAMIAKLESLSDDEGSYIVREQTHKQKTNPEAYEVERKMKALEKENEALKENVQEKVSEAVGKVTESAAAEIKRLKEKHDREIEELKTKNTGSNRSGGNR